MSKRRRWWQLKEIVGKKQVLVCGVLHANPFLQAHTCTDTYMLTSTVSDGTWRLGVAGEWSGEAGGEGDLDEAEAACSIPVKVGECIINEINI